ncbi:MAG: phytanoyl-CoA dioxygenase family protein [Acidimicrobiia bacterium]|nr:phytanoyl-CoA dioxygenase family protein [Acidimicrobiia bacterium]
MQLSTEQVAAYRTKGWVVVPDSLGEAEVAVVTEAALEVLERPGPEVGREADGSPHVCWGMHLFDERLATLTRHPGLVKPSRQLLANDIYVHQSRINMKQTNGSIVAWHQDFGTYHRVDGVPDPRGIMIAVFCDDVTAVNAPLLAVPGSQREGLVSTAAIDPTAPDHAEVARYRYDITDDTMAELVDRYGLETITATAGSVLFMDMTVVHGSSVNISPLRRLLLYVNVCPIDNCGLSFERPEYYAARDFAPLEPLDAGCLDRFQAGTIPR